MGLPAPSMQGSALPAVDLWGWFGLAAAPVNYRTARSPGGGLRLEGRWEESRIAKGHKGTRVGEGTTREAVEARPREIFRNCAVPISRVGE